jgi:translation initiation factor 2D
MRRVPVGIGKTYLSGEDMYMSAMKGKCLSILHIYQDNLWALGDQSIQVPFIPSPVPIPKQLEELNEPKEDRSEEESKSELAQGNLDEQMEKVKIDERDQQEQAEKKCEIEQRSEEEQEETKTQVNHEQILEEAFLCAVKFKSKELKLPVLVSTFMKILQSCW